MTDEQKAGELLRRYLDRDGLSLLDDGGRVTALSLDLSLPSPVRHAVPQIVQIGVARRIAEFKGREMTQADLNRLIGTADRELGLNRQVLKTAIAVWCHAFEVKLPSAGPETEKTPEVVTPETPKSSTDQGLGSSTAKVVPQGQGTTTQTTTVTPQVTPTPFAGWADKNWARIGFGLVSALLLTLFWAWQSGVSAVLGAANPSRNDHSFSWKTALAPADVLDSPAFKGKFFTADHIWTLLLPCILIWQIVTVLRTKPPKKAPFTVWGLLAAGSVIAWFATADREGSGSTGLWLGSKISSPAQLIVVLLLGIVTPILLLSWGGIASRSAWKNRWLWAVVAILLLLTGYDAAGLSSLNLGSKTARVQYLIDHGLDRDVVDRYDDSLLDYCVGGEGSDDEVRMLVARGDRLTHPPSLMNSLSTMSAEHVQLLLQAGASATESLSSGYTLLHAAAKSGSDGDVIRTLVKDGAKIDATDSHKETPLMAAYEGGGKSAGALLEAGADASLADDRGRTALHYAAEYASVADIKLLLDHHPNLEAEDSDGETPIFYAAKRTDTGPAQALKDAGASVTASEKAGKWRPVFYASTVDMLKLLWIEPELSGYTLLHHAASEGWLDVARYLVEEKGDDPGAVYKGSDGKFHTPASYAHDQGNSTVAGYLDKQLALWADRDLAGAWQLTEYWGSRNSSLDLAKGDQVGSDVTYTGTVHLSTNDVDVTLHLDRKSLGVTLEETHSSGDPRWHLDTGSGKLDTVDQTVSGSINYPGGAGSSFSFKKGP